MVRESGNLGAGSVCTRCSVSQPELQTQTMSGGKLNMGRKQSPAASYICCDGKEIDHETVGVASIELVDFLSRLGHVVPQFHSRTLQFFAAVLLKGGPRGYLTNLYIDYPAWFRVMCTVGELAFGGSLARNRRGGGARSPSNPSDSPSDSPRLPPAIPAPVSS